jgi:hypothetical protein
VVYVIGLKLLLIGWCGYKNVLIHHMYIARIHYVYCVCIGNVAAREVYIYTAGVHYVDSFSIGYI